MKIFRNWFAWLGVLVGAMSSVSAISEIFQIGLSGFYLKFLDFYRNMLSPIVEIAKNFDLIIDPATLDFFIIYLVCFMMSLRADFLPLFQSEVWSTERYRFSKNYEKIVAEKPEEFPENMYHGKVLEDGSYKLYLTKMSPRWLILISSAVATFFLLPVFTVKPIRTLLKINNQYFPNLIKAALMMTPEERSLPLFDYKTESGEGSITVEYMEYARAMVIVVAQMLCLPIAIILFFVLAKYNPII